MTTEELMQLSLDMVQMKEIPADSAIHVPGRKIRKILFAVDVDPAHILYAREAGFDCVLGHHPRGEAEITYYAVLQRQTLLLESLGVHREEAEGATRRLRQSFFYSSHRANWENCLQLAKALEMPLLNIHNPLDELGRRLLQAKMDEREKVGWQLKDILSALLEFEEIACAPLPPVIAMGEEEDLAGRLAVFHGAGTNGGYAVADALFRFGWNTVLYIHIDYPELERLREEKKGNLIISGHIPSDMVGINPYLRELERRGIEVKKLSEL